MSAIKIFAVLFLMSSAAFALDGIQVLDPDFFSAGAGLLEGGTQSTSYGCSPLVSPSESPLAPQSESSKIGRMVSDFCVGEPKIERVLNKRKPGTDYLMICCYRKNSARPARNFHP